MMRAVTLADDKVRELLNGYTVPCYASNDEFDPKKRRKLSQEDLDIWMSKIHAATLNAGFDSGNVCVYILSPDGKPVDGIIVAQACQPNVLIPRLEAAIKKHNVKKGDPLIKPALLSNPPKVKEDSRVAHLVARCTERAWMPTPAENCIVFDPEKQKKLLPGGNEKVGASWEIDKDVALEILCRFLPNIENTHFRIDRFKSHSLKATVVSIEKGTARARVEGSFEFKHDFYPGRPETANTSEGNVVGYIDFDPAQRNLKSLKLLAPAAKYGDMRFTVAVSSEP